MELKRLEMTYCRAVSETCFSSELAALKFFFESYNFVIPFRGRKKLALTLEGGYGVVIMLCEEEKK